jgi:hypothetical protein
MGIWIRSQNKRVLVHANAIHEYQGEIFASQNDVSGGSLDSGYAVGRYETGERALEILDSIQQITIAATIFQSPIMAHRNMVFQMPEK